MSGKGTAGRTPVWLGMGTNLGDRERNLRKAVELLNDVCGPLALSDVFETPPWGDLEQPAFLNLVARGQTPPEPGALLRRLKEIEAAVGRRPTRRWGPRVIDVDILAYGTLHLMTPELTVPHAHLSERAFVLVPLANLDPGWVHPVLGHTAAQLLENLPPAEVAAVRRWGRLA